MCGWKFGGDRGRRDEANASKEKKGIIKSEGDQLDVDCVLIMNGDYAAGLIIKYTINNLLCNVTMIVWRYNINILQRLFTPHKAS